MDYEKKYKETLERAKGFLKRWEDIEEANTFLVLEELKDIFPELTESKDERIRKTLIKFHKGSIDIDGIKGSEIVSWLEKQKEYESTDFEYVWDRTDCGDLTSALDKYSEEAIINMCHAWYDKGIELERKSWLEKQSESDETKAKIFLINKGYPIDANGVFPTYEEMYNIIREGLEKQGDKPKGKTALEAINEEKVDNSNKIELKDYNTIDPHFGKPVDFKAEDWYTSKVDGKIHNFYHSDKPKPKFKVGDWIINKYMHLVMQIIDNDNGYYKTVEIDGTERNDSYDFIEHTFKLWTIHYAEDGDVLVVPKIDGSENSEQIFIFREIKNRDYVKNAVEHYCRVVNNKFYVNSQGYMGQSDDYFVPATKEQRDLLFSKMKDAGYEWDAEKKELRKIEPKIKVSSYDIDTGYSWNIDKPKFKVGDWVVDKSGFAQQVLDFRCGIYTCTYNSFSTDCESNYHLWTIDDAKNGDILYIKSGKDEWVIIFISMHSGGYIMDHCSYCINTSFYSDNSVPWGKVSKADIIHPATKEQCDLLFSKIREKDYEWDTKNKQLNEIES